MSHVVELLKTARATISSPSRWTKGVSARDIYAEQTDVTCGVCFCALGALCLAKRNRRASHDERDDAELALMRQLPANKYTIADFNDAPATTHADVLALFDRAIASLEQSQ